MDASVRHEVLFVCHREVGTVSQTILPNMSRDIASVEMGIKMDDRDGAVDFV